MYSMHPVNILCILAFSLVVGHSKLMLKIYGSLFSFFLDTLYTNLYDKLKVIK